MKRFDDQLAENIREVFDTYGEELDPRAWNAMQQRLQKRKRARIIAFIPPRAWAAMAATLFLGVTAWVFLQSPEFFQSSNQQAFRQVENNIPAAGKQQVPERHESSVAGETTHTETHKRALPPVAAPQIAEKLVHTPAPQPAEHSLVAATHVEMARVDDQVLVSAEESLAKNSETKPAIVLPPARSGSVGSPAIAIHPDPFADMDLTKDPVHSWGVAAGSMLAFANQGISSEPGLAAGVISEWRVSPNITLATGGLLTYHQFELVDYSGGRHLYYDSSPTGEPGQINVSSNNQYELLALDIPINAQFNLTENDSRRVYFGAGLSSVLFLQQRFTGLNTQYYNSIAWDPLTGAYHGQIISETVMVDQKHDAFSRFDLARLMNLSMGYVIKSDRGSYIIEPFIKYPLGRVTSKNLRLGMGGVSLRYNFGR